MKKIAFILLCTASPILCVSALDVLKQHCCDKIKACQANPDKLTCKYFWLKLQPRMNCGTQNPHVSQVPQQDTAETHSEETPTAPANPAAIDIHDPAAVEAHLQKSSEQSNQK